MSSWRLVLALAFTGLVLGGCVRRTIQITSDPSGALVWLNDREVGRTPLDVEFVHYGTYDVRLVHDGYEPVATFGEAKPPWWDNIGLDLAAELLPADLRSDIAWHYVLSPYDPDVDRRRERLVEDAQSLRSMIPDE